MDAQTARPGWGGILIDLTLVAAIVAVILPLFGAALDSSETDGELRGLDAKAPEKPLLQADDGVLLDKGHEVAGFAGDYVFKMDAGSTRFDRRTHQPGMNHANAGHRHDM